ncbi:MAG: hypothetical protein ACK5AZ_23755 [Bryobacteraceae bacterium]
MWSKLLLVAGCTGVLLWAADPWKAKKAADWNEKDVKRVLTDSPWARSIPAEMAAPMMGGRGGGGRGRGGGGMGGGGMTAETGMMGGAGGEGGGGGGGRGMGGGDPRPEPPKILVRWESAIPVREAYVRAEQHPLAKIEELSAEYFVISASGLKMPGGGRGGPGGGQQKERPQADPQRMGERLKEATSLTVKGREPIRPAHVHMFPSPGGLVSVFLFPRAEVTAADREVTFQTAFGPMKFKGKFPLKEMIFDGRPAL